MTDGLHGLPVPALVDSDPKDKPRLVESQHPAGADVRPFVLPDAFQRDRVALTARLIWAAHLMASFKIQATPGNLGCDVYCCKECGRSAYAIADIAHQSSCAPGCVLELVFALAKLPEPGSPQKNDVQEEGPQPPAEGSTPSRGPAWIGPNQVRWDMSAEYAERLKACVVFCEGIPTEDLKRELPLASPLRRRFHEIQHLRRALPWLPAVQL